MSVMMILVMKMMELSVLDLTDENLPSFGYSYYWVLDEKKGFLMPIEGLGLQLQERNPLKQSVES